MNKKPSKLFRQKRNSQMCGPSSLAFAMQYFNEGVSPSDVADELVISKDFGIGLFDLALYPINRGYETKLFAWSAENFPVKWRDSSSKKIKDSLEKKNPKNNTWKHSLLSFLKKKGEFYAEPVFPEKLEKYLQKGFGVILYLDSNVLYKHADGVWGHYVVLTKCNKNRWSIFDPHWKYGGHKSYPKDLLLFSFYSVGGYCLVFRKK